MSPFRALAMLAGGLGTGAICLAQTAISAHSGLVQLTVGSVYVQDKAVHKTVTDMLQVKPSEVVRTGTDGYAEILLTPGVFLRLGNNTSFRMDSDALTHTHLTLLSGSAMVECDELLPDNNVTFDVGSKPVELRKKGLYRLMADPPAVATIQGELFVAGNMDTTVKKGKLLQFDAAVPQPVKFHNDKKDELYTFSKARSEDSAYATGVTSSSLLSSGYGCTGGSSWYLMGSVGMYSYLPCSGIYSNAFGYSFLGLNNGYMWGGPSYYIPPYGLLGGYAGYGGYGGGYVPSAVAGGRGRPPVTARPGTSTVATSSPARVPVKPPKNATVVVPVFGGPNGNRSMPVPMGAMQGASRNGAFASPNAHNAAMNSRALSRAAGPMIGHVPASRSPGRSQGGFSGGAASPRGSYSGGAPSRVYSGAPAAAGRVGAGSAGGSSGGAAPRSGGGSGGVRGR